MRTKKVTEEVFDRPEIF